MDLEIFEHIGQVLDVYESKKDVYKLIAEEVKDFFENMIFTESDYEFNFTYRIKSGQSIREKLIRNNYVVKSGGAEKLIADIQDILGFRIECKFMEEEKEAYALLQKWFTGTEDGAYYFLPSMPKIRLKLSEPQPQKQKNGFEIYKLDGLYMLGRESVRFELQIKALVNVFWGEVEHRVVYKNNDYLLADTFVPDFLKSIKNSLNMIDSQLYVFYNRFKQEQEAEKAERDRTRAIEIFIANMVYDTFDQLMKEQLGFSVDFKHSCDAVIRYVVEKNGADKAEDYGRVMLKVFDSLSEARESVRLDEQMELAPVSFQDEFSRVLFSAIQKYININYRWHLYFAILFSLEKGSREECVSDCIAFFKKELQKNTSLQALGEKGRGEMEEELLAGVAKKIYAKKKIEYLCAPGLVLIHKALNATAARILEEGDWKNKKEEYIGFLEKQMSL